MQALDIRNQLVDNLPYLLRKRQKVSWSFSRELRVSSLFSATTAFRLRCRWRMCTRENNRLYHKWNRNYFVLFVQWQLFEIIVRAVLLHLISENHGIRPICHLVSIGNKASRISEINFPVWFQFKTYDNQHVVGYYPVTYRSSQFRATCNYGKIIW